MAQQSSPVTSSDGAILTQRDIHRFINQLDPEDEDDLDVLVNIAVEALGRSRRRDDVHSRIKAAFTYARTVEAERRQGDREFSIE